MTSRPPAVAGMFYPADKQQLQAMVGDFLAEESAQPLSADQQQSIKALIVPHAGFIYSGPVAASAYRLLQNRRNIINRVVLLGPSHRVPFRGLALPDSDRFSTPLGDILLDQAGMQQLLGLKQVHVSAQAHAYEHSLEVQLPFLQSVFNDFRLLPIVVGACEVDLVKAALRLVWGCEETLIVISTDLSHYHHYDRAREIDRHTAELIIQKQSQLHGEQACGCQPLNGLLKLASELSLSICPLDLRNSGDTAGDKDRVVGYGAFAVY